MTIDGQPWFVAADVFRMIGLGNPTMALRTVLAERRTLKTFEGKPTNLITESALYDLVMRAQKRNPKAVEFQTWVTGTVLLAIRKDGMYVQGEEKLDPNNEADLDKLVLSNFSDH